MTAYYNEIDPFAAKWLRELIKAGAIAPGTVDERSIEDVRPADLRGFAQCHFFAGIGVWSRALRQSGWSDDRPVWTGSCPCQPFSAAGKGAGFADERHLWPALFHLIEQCRPAIVFGEQVASKAVEPWIDLVQVDLEAVGYAFGCVPFPSASVGAPHIRDRAYWAADASGSRHDRKEQGAEGNSRDEARMRVSGAECGFGGVAHAECIQEHQEQQRPAKDEREWRPNESCRRNTPCRLGNAESDGREQWRTEPSGPERIATSSIPCGLADAECVERFWRGSGKTVLPQRPEQRTERFCDDAQRSSATCPTNGFWRNVDWLFCRDGKWRPVRPGSFPLVNGASQRVGRLRGYGNAINAEAAKAFIEAFMEGEGDD